MRHTTLLLALLLSQLLTGCITLSASKMGRNYDGPATYTAVYSDGMRLVASYEIAGHGERWMEVDVSAMKWVPLASVNTAKPSLFTMKTGAPRPAHIAGMRNISLYPRPYGNESFYVKLGIRDADRRKLEGLILDGELHRKDATREPFTAYDGVVFAQSDPDMLGVDPALTLIRDDPQHPGELQVLNLAVDRDPRRALRIASYPFAVALDIVAIPVYLVGAVLLVVIHPGG